MDSLQHLNLTEKDFQLIVDGLDALPERGAAGEMMSELFMGLISKDETGRDTSEFDRKMSRVKAERNREKEALKEDVKILQGKILMLKRYLIENKLMTDTHSILNNIS